MKEKIHGKDLAAILLGMLIVAASVYYLMMPNDFVVGSLSGVVLLLAHFLPLSVPALTMILNILLLVLSFLFVDQEFGGKTVLASLLLPFYLWIFETVTPEVPRLTDDLFINMLCFILAISLGQMILFNSNASSGGLDILAKMMNKYLHWDLGKSLSLCGFFVSACSILVYDRQIMVISLLGTYLSGVILDQFLDGSHVRKQITILSAHYPEIQDYILHTLYRGATLYPAQGAWDGSQQVALVTVMEPSEYAHLRSFLAEIDPDAFVTVSTVSEVLGRWDPPFTKTNNRRR